MSKSLFLLAFLLSFSLYSQSSPIDALTQLPLSATVKEKMVLKSQISAYIDLNSDDAVIQRLVEIAEKRNDSIFLGLAYRLQGNLERSKQVSRNYGFHLQYHQSVQSLFDELNIFYDKNGNTTFAEIRDNNQLFENNETDKPEANYNPNDVYWGKVILYGDSEKTEEYLFNFSANNEFESWRNIDTWLVHENDSITYYQTGDRFAEANKPVPSKLNLLRFPIQKNEKITLYFRLQGVDIAKFRKPKAVKIFMLDEDKHPGYFPDYPFKGKYQVANQKKAPFSTNVILNQDLYIDNSGIATIDEIIAQQANLDWKRADEITHEQVKVYWMKVRFCGSPYFNGEQILHISPFDGSDRFSFDYINSYVSTGDGNYHHQRTGEHVPLDERPFDHWVNFIKIDIGAQDTLDLFVRMEGVDARYLYHNEAIKLYHVDPVSLFPYQSNYAFKNGVFAGILAIQSIFFLLLFLIEKERTHLYFAILIIGVFLSLNFQELNYISYVLFPTIRDFHTEFNALGSFCISLGLLKFIEKYFNYAKTSFYAKWVVPIWMALSTVIFVNYVFQFQVFDENFNIYTKKSYYKMYVGASLLSVIIATIAFIFATKQKNVSKLFLAFAYLPLSVVSVGYMAAMLTGHESIFLFEQLTRGGIMLTLTFLSLSIGYRTNRLKAEKTAALKQSFINEKAAIENQLKTQLYTNITHEFRTPLTVIMGINEELQKNKLNQPNTKKQKQGHQLIQRNSENLLQLINQLLDLSKVDSGMLSLNLKQSDIVNYFNYLTESFHSKAQEKDIQLVFYPETPALIMDFDEAKIQQLVYNLLSNALKFTSKKGKVVFHVKQTTKDGQDFLKMKVTDNGNGIAAEKLPHIFERFYQVDDSSTRHGEGTGIGLALAKEWVKLMGGTIVATSDIDKGTTFTILLPIQNTAETKAPNQLSVSIESLPITEKKVALPTVEDSPVDSDLPLILIVEDNSDVTIYLQQILERNYQIQTAVNGETGIKKAFEIIPDIIISDVMMPKMDGFVLTETLKSDIRTSHIPIILLTAKAAEADKLTGLKTGADAYLTKPFNKEELYIRLKNLLHLRQLLQQQFAEANLTEKQVLASTKTTNTPNELFIQQLRDLIQANLNNEHLNAELMCQKVTLSQSQLYRKLKALTDETPSLFIRNIRLQKAMELLKTTDLNISEIAYQVGFNDPNYFSRAFNKAFGQSPSVFRS